MDRVLRLFVAIAPPGDLGDAMARAAASGAADGLFALPSHRIIPASDQHMTLAFIGETRSKELRSVIESVDRASAGFPAFELVPRALITIPTPEDGGPPRLLAVQTDAPSPLLEIQRRLAMRLTKPKRNGHRARFLPHVTVARYAHALTSEPINHPVQLPAWPVREIVLYQSTLKGTGAEYAALHAATLED